MIIKDHLLWNEQYLLEAFLTCNKEFKIIGALNFLHAKHKDLIDSKCPVLAQQDYRKLGSIWLKKC